MFIMFIVRLLACTEYGILCRPFVPAGDLGFLPYNPFLPAMPLYLSLILAPRCPRQIAGESLP